MFEIPDHNLLHASALSANVGVDLDTLRYRAFYEVGKDHMSIQDPVWGEEYIGEEPHDQILVELAHTDALRRLQTIEQLTLPERYSTIPDSYYFSRWEHVWGSLVFVRRMSRMMGLEPKESMYLQLKVLLSDFKHTAFSHAGDWMFQEEGGPETEHENRSDYSQTVGITRLLELFHFDPARVLDDKTHDITDRPLPEIDADRIDYTMRESYRWVDQSPVMKEHLNAETFKVIEGQLVAKDIMGAKMLAVCHTLLLTEYWHDPVERLQLNLLLESLKRVFVSSNGRSSLWGSYSPRDLMTTADHTLIERLRKHDEFIHILDNIMTGVADSEKRIHWVHRSDHVHQVLERTVGKEKGSVAWVRDYYDMLPPTCEVTEIDADTPLQETDRTVVIKLPAHRQRFIDPAFVDEEGNVQKLSNADPVFWQLLQDMIAPTRKDWNATLVQNKATTEVLKRCFAQTREAWPEVMERPRLSSAVIRGLLRTTVETSPAYASKFIGFTLKH